MGHGYPWIPQQLLQITVWYPFFQLKMQGLRGLAEQLCGGSKKKIGKEVQDDVVSINGGNPKLSIFNWEFPL